MKKLALALSVVATISSSAIAEGNVEAGKAKSITCAACHGVDGNSMINMYPKIAQQHATYLQKQLQEFRTAAQTGGSNGRMDPIMSSMAAALSDEDIMDLSAYYSSQAITPNDVADIPSLGETLYNGGDMSRGITACIACHGPEGQGMALAGFPSLAGQHANYIKIQLDKFHDGSRNNDMNGMMRDVAKKLSPQDIDALSVYISNFK
ncbi:cytochrome c [Shewanella sp. NIFS-20-20]|uniref:c-type cytochrome n=1 Tax=Shewanella sp. NIFS-20-20 TaxID=2853806 RepID=UPI001C4940D6|nr:c-type cytochrome [Shewanella sp. NIFS-20-20]MBV7316110.1 cytochrome c4 [Shewanella sp. NIFS-20-20]